MAKGIGLIGNFRGKVGNMVGYNLKDSNNKQTQGVRVYQPIVKNPKTYAQAEQRAKLAPINALYRALKPVIDRGQEGKAYGNKSRLAWLKQALINFNSPWIEKGASVVSAPLVPISHGSLAPVGIVSPTDGACYLEFNEQTSAPTTMGALSTALLDYYPQLRNGDQITFVMVMKDIHGGMIPSIVSIVVDTASTSAIPSDFSVTTSTLTWNLSDDNGIATSIILSREGSNGEHLRSSASLHKGYEYDDSKDSDAAKEAAIKSYMSGGSNTDWAEESLQG